MLLLSTIQQRMDKSGGSWPLQHPHQSSSHQDRLPHYGRGDREDHKQIQCDQCGNPQQRPHDPYRRILCHPRHCDQGWYSVTLYIVFSVATCVSYNENCVNAAGGWKLSQDIDTPALSQKEYCKSTVKSSPNCQPYFQKIQYREKEKIRDIVKISPRLTVLEIGCAADDTILWQIGKTCNALRTLKFGGNEVTDRGVYWMIGGGAISKDDLQCPIRFQSDVLNERPRCKNSLCVTLYHLDMSRAIMVSEKAVSQCWKSCVNLRHFNIKESHLWQLLRNIKKTECWSNFVIPLKRLEITTRCSQVGLAAPNTSL